MKNEEEYKAPILLILFNRPETTKEVFNAIKKYKPHKLFIAADGPRPYNQNDVKKCGEAREVVSDHYIDWPCEVHRNYIEANQGCRMGVSNAIHWFFEHVDQGIILEDDCVPDQSFFHFASEMLNIYKDDARIMHINGSNFQQGNVRGNADYFFSRLVHVWGWATWKDAWQTYDVEMSDLSQTIKSKRIENMFTSPAVAKFWISLFKHIKNKNIDTWDTQWNYAIFKNNGYTISPNKNLVLNIGFSNEATHTRQGDTSHDVPIIDSMSSAPLKHPTSLIYDKSADEYVVKSFYIKPLSVRIIHKMKRIISSFIKEIK